MSFPLISSDTKVLAGLKKNKQICFFPIQTVSMDPLDSQRMDFSPSTTSPECTFDTTECPFDILTEDALIIIFSFLSLYDRLTLMRYVLATSYQFQKKYAD